MFSFDQIKELKELDVSHYRITIDKAELDNLLCKRCRVGNVDFYGTLCGHMHCQECWSESICDSGFRCPECGCEVIGQLVKAVSKDKVDDIDTDF